MNEEKISIYRIIPILGIIVTAIVSAGILCIVNKLEIDQIFCILFVIAGFVPIIVFELIYERNRKMIAQNSQTTYGRVSIGFFVCCIVMIAISFMPEFLRPVLLFPLIISAFGNETLGLMIGMFANVLLALTTGGSFHELLCYTILMIIGVMLLKALDEKTYRLYIGMIFMFASILFPNVFYFLTYEELLIKNLFISIVNGLIISVFVSIFYPSAKKVTEEEVYYQYEHLLDDNYIQIREVRAYSLSEYMHARKVSKIAKKYALNLGFDANLCEAAGFYYRIGRWVGNSVVENGVQKAKELCFPDQLIQILSEYYGEVNKPSTPESALVHIIDALLIKLELLEKEVGTSQWNREVLIYQTLNEFSTAGLYDQSGLSINAFIKIREWLAKEELL
ncbi:MAG: hypothetical protein IJ958_09160 [Agathobacter sp.]|nr:hypothetical protein [Agathobacter sp.]